MPEDKVGVTPQAQRFLTRWVVPPYLMSSALESGMMPPESQSDRNHPRKILTRGRFLLLAAERKPEITHDLFKRASESFNKVIISKKLYHLLWGTNVNNLHFAVGNLFDGEGDDITDKEVVLLSPLLNAVSEWAKDWRFPEDWHSPFCWFAYSALVGGTYFMPGAKPVPISASKQSPLRHIKPLANSIFTPSSPTRGFDSCVIGWEHAAKDLLKLAHDKSLHPALIQTKNIEPVYKPPAGFPLYVGIGRETYIQECKKNLDWLINNSLLKGISEARQKDIRSWIEETAGKYCARVEGALAEQGYKRLRRKTKFARDLTMTVELVVLKWDWAKIARGQKENINTVKSAVDEMLGELGISREPFFNERSGRPDRAGISQKL